MSEPVYYLIQLGLLLPVLCCATWQDLKTRTIRNGSAIALLVGKCFLFLLLIASWWWKNREMNGFFTSLAYDELFTTGVGFLLALLILVPCRLLAKEGLGMGDVKLLLALSIYLGATLFLRALALTSLITVAVTLILMARKKIDRETTLPFAPFITAGAILSALIRIL